MRIVIDLQGAQAESKYRGIGRYSLSLAKAIVRNRGGHEIFLALNGLFPDTIEATRAAFGNLLPQTNIRIWHAPNPVDSLNANNKWRRENAELVREAFLASLKPDMVVISSMFEGLTADVVTSIGRLTLNIPTSVILYDLIPLVFRDPYLLDPSVESWYENKLGHLRRASLLLAISESSRQDGIHHLNFPAERVINISAAAEPEFLPRRVSEDKESEVRQRYGLQRPFVMYTGGIDHRKNIEGLIRAYAKLSKPLRTGHQLAIVCSIHPTNRSALEALAKEQGLTINELVLTGFVPEDDLIVLYNLCKLFVFPSWYEGFGLPALEAMCCGRAVIGANHSSLPEVIGHKDALFDPHSDESIAEKISQVLSDDTLRQQLQQHGLKQAQRFSWDHSGKAAIAAIEAWHTNHKAPVSTSCATSRRPKLAYVSPLPPARSGISNYGAELLPELARHYDIEVILAQDSNSDPWIKANCPVRNVQWLEAHSDYYDRVLYHFGNSTFHQHMFDLLDKVPGVVVLHDFFLGHVTEYLGSASGDDSLWPATLYEDHGYSALNDRFTKDISSVAWKYPCNLRVLEKAFGVIVHSDNSKRLASSWYGENAANDWTTIPHPRAPALSVDRTASRNLLDLEQDAFVVCSFGFLGKNKCNDRLLESWLASLLAKSDKCVLVFVGENDSGEYGDLLVEKIARSGAQTRIRITGWASTATYNHYMMAADACVQLRTLSRGETSLAVLDCMSHGLATIVNAHGSMADLPNDGVWMLTDEFEDLQLTQALEILWKNGVQRRQLGENACRFVRTKHAPRACADQYFVAIEKAYRAAETNLYTLTQKLGKLSFGHAEPMEWQTLANALSTSFQPELRTRQLLVDISALVQLDSKTGIQRVVRSVLLELLTNPPDGYRVEPIQATPGQGYCYARSFTLRLLGHPDCILSDEPIEFYNDDLFIGLDLQHHVVLSHGTFYQQMRNQGVQLYFVVYDLLPVLLPHYFEPGTAEMHHNWLKSLACCDGVICISRAVAKEIIGWLDNERPPRLRPFNVGYFHLGADIHASTLSTSLPACDLPANAESVLAKIASHPSFLMVGTVEPRKGHAQTLAAFEELWKDGIAVNLVIVGKEGWLVEGLISKIRNHPKLRRHLFWLEGISDQYLERVYAASSCLIAASEGEGFGLPLIEAAQHKLPIIARDIPVFREIAREFAYYFTGLDASSMSKAIRDWLELKKNNKIHSSHGVSWQTWAQATRQLLEVVLNDKWTARWMPAEGRDSL
jgi:glycosyltransferase involved in cell wall biosynthesis